MFKDVWKVINNVLNRDKLNNPEDTIIVDGHKKTNHKEIFVKEKCANFFILRCIPDHSLKQYFNVYTESDMLTKISVAACGLG